MIFDFELFDFELFDFDYLVLVDSSVCIIWFNNIHGSGNAKITASFGKHQSCLKRVKAHPLFAVLAYGVLRPMGQPVHGKTCIGCCHCELRSNPVLWNSRQV